LRGFVLDFVVQFCSVDIPFHWFSLGHMWFSEFMVLTCFCFPLIFFESVFTDLVGNGFAANSRGTHFRVAYIFVMNYLI